MVLPTAKGGSALTLACSLIRPQRNLRPKISPLTAGRRVFSSHGGCPWAVALQRGPAVPPSALESASQTHWWDSGSLAGRAAHQPIQRPLCPHLSWWTVVDKSLVGAAMRCLFPCRGPQGVGTVLLILRVRSRLGAEMEPGLHLRPGACVFLCQLQGPVHQPLPCPGPLSPEHLLSGFLGNERGVKCGGRF